VPTSFEGELWDSRGAAFTAPTRLRGRRNSLVRDLRVRCCFPCESVAAGVLRGLADAVLIGLDYGFGRVLNTDESRQQVLKCWSTKKPPTNQARTMVMDNSAGKDPSAPVVLPIARVRDVLLSSGCVRTVTLDRVPSCERLTHHLILTVARSLPVRHPRAQDHGVVARI